MNQQTKVLTSSPEVKRADLAKEGSKLERESLEELVRRYTE